MALTTIPTRHVPTSCKWVFHIKENLDGTIKEEKAILWPKASISNSV